MSILTVLPYVFEYGPFVLAGIVIALGSIKVFKKVRAGDVVGAKSDAHKVADKIVDVLVDVIERLDLKKAKTEIEKEIKKDKQVESALNVRLKSKGYLEARKEGRGN